MRSSRPTGAGLELVQESNVVLIEQTDIVDLEAAHNHTLQTDAEGVAGVFIRVDAARLKHLGVNHAAAEDLDPALALCRAGSLHRGSGNTGYPSPQTAR